MPTAITTHKNREQGGLVERRGELKKLTYQANMNISNDCTMHTQNSIG